MPEPISLQMNTRVERRSMPTVLIEQAIQSAQKTLQRYGLGTVLSIGLVCFLCWLMVAQIKGVREDTVKAMAEQSLAIQGLRSDLRDHMWQTSFYMHQLCVISSVQSGTNPQGCEIPQIAR